MTFDDLPLMLTVEETARTLRCGRTATYEAIRRGEIPSIRIGRSLRVPRHQLARLLGLDATKGPGTGPLINSETGEPNGSSPG